MERLLIVIKENIMKELDDKYILLRCIFPLDIVKYKIINILAQEKFEEKVAEEANLTLKYIYKYKHSKNVEKLYNEFYFWLMCL